MVPPSELLYALRQAGDLNGYRKTIAAATSAGEDNQLHGALEKWLSDQGL